MPLRTQFNFLPKLRYGVYLVVFCMYGFAGVAFLFIPSPVVSEGGPAILVLWHAFLMTGGLVSTVGVITKRKFIEIAGLPLLCSALLAYVVLILEPIFKGQPVYGPIVGFACIIFAAMLCLVDRAVSLWGWIRAAEALQAKYADEGE